MLGNQAKGEVIITVCQLSNLILEFIVRFETQGKRLRNRINRFSTKPQVTTTGQQPKNEDKFSKDVPLRRIPIVSEIDDSELVLSDNGQVTSE